MALKKLEEYVITSHESKTKLAVPISKFPRFRDGFAEKFIVFKKQKQWFRVVSQNQGKKLEKKFVKSNYINFQLHWIVIREKTGNLCK